MTLLDEVIARTQALGLPTDLADRQVQRYGNMVNQHIMTESRAGRLVRQLEDHFRIHPSRRAGPLGARFKRICDCLSPR